MLMNSYSKIMGDAWKASLTLHYSNYVFLILLYEWHKVFLEWSMTIENMRLIWEKYLIVLVMRWNESPRLCFSCQWKSEVPLTNKRSGSETEKSFLIFSFLVLPCPNFDMFFLFLSFCICDGTLSFFLLKYPLISLHISSKCNSLLFCLMLFISYTPFLDFAWQFH